MEELVRGRRPIRFMFEELETEIKELVKVSPVDLRTVEIKFDLFKDCCASLARHDELIKKWMLENNETPEVENNEYREMLSFKARATSIQMEAEGLGLERHREHSISGESTISGAHTQETKQRNFKLHPVQVKKFNGDLKEWVSFWGQFSKIDEDEMMDGSDKFWYLLEALQPGSEAHELVSIYPHSAENYPVAIAALKKRFGDPDLLLQVYVRELLSLVIANVNSKDKTPVKNLFNKIDSYLRALRLLNVEKADPDAWLFPLVESCLPESLHREWLRSSKGHSEENGGSTKTRLEQLMKFMEAESEMDKKTEIKEKFAVGAKKAVTSDSRPGSHTRVFTNTKKIPNKNVALFYSSDLTPCVFCDRTNHKLEDCFRARKMSYKEKKAILLRKGKCFRCCGDHLFHQCEVQGLLCGLCGGRHLTALCFGTKRQSEEVTPPAKRSRLQNTIRTVNYSNQIFASEVALQTVMAEIGVGSKRKLVRVFLDCGSQRSYLLKNTVIEMEMKPTGMESVTHSMFGGHRTGRVNHLTYDVTLHSLNSNFSKLLQVRDQDVICNNIENVVKSSHTLERELNRHQIQINDYEYGHLPIELMIGSDYYGKVLTGKIIELDCGYDAVETVLGWTLLGKLNEDEKSSIVSTYMNMNVNDATVTQLWELDTLGIRDPTEVKSAMEIEEEAKAKFFSSISRNQDGRYCVGLPWREDHPPLPTYKEVCRVRMRKAYEKLQGNGLVSEYSNIFKDWKRERFIEESFDVKRRGSYVPHRPIIKVESSTTPIRPVFNASFKTGTSPSLNDCLHKGSNYIQKIPAILYRFREKPVAFVSDIRKAFQMIEVHEADRDAMRFLWKDNRGNEIEYRHARVMFGATCSPFILGAVLEHFLNGVTGTRSTIARKLLESFYVDNCVASVDTRRDFEEFKKISVELMNEICMDLRLWHSNLAIKEDEEEIVPVLGMNWDRATDELFLKLSDLAQPETVTKKVVLSIVQKIYDVLGITTPAVLPMKLLLQRTWINKLSWDDPLPEEEENAFRMWLEDLPKLKEIRIPRHFTGGIGTREDWSIHTFCDASNAAYGTVVFLRINSEGKVSVQMLDSKAKVAPLNRMTIPRLELLGCLLGSRLTSNIKEYLAIEDFVPITYWTDSSTALSWINRNEAWGTFVHNRVKEIRTLTTITKWKHIPGIYNPADVVSRGCSIYDLVNSRWWEGPSWLKGDETEWPRSSPEEKEEEISSELKKSATIKKTTTMTLIEEARHDHSFRSRVRIIGWVLRFIQNCRLVAENRRKDSLTADELRKAENLIIKEIQQKFFPEEDRKDLRDLDIFEDEAGVLRVKTRLTNRTDFESFKYPALLSAKDETVRRLILDSHRAYVHAGVGFLMTKLREKYWIVKARKSIYGVISKCVRCRKLKAKPNIPRPAPLPKERIQDCEIFETVGVDLFGPLTLKAGEKVWVTIFTCAVYRAVHFEVIKSISSAAFVAALKRFIMKYRRPKVIHCDNGTNFRGADKMFKSLDWPEINTYDGLKPIFFKYSPPNSSWWGGYWERLIRTAKDLMKRTIGNGSCSRKEFEYLLEAVAEVMNGRPLTYITEDPGELEPLTPNHFLRPWGNVKFPEAELTEAQKFRFRYQYVKTVQKELQRRFRTEYLGMLVSRNKKKSIETLKIGDLVFVGSDNRKRTAWPMGRILNFLTGPDGVNRVAEVKTEGGIFIRTVQNLYPLELENDKNQLEKEKQEETAKQKEKAEEVIATRSGRIVRPPLRFRK